MTPFNLKLLKYQRLRQRFTFWSNKIHSKISDENVITAPFQKKSQRQSKLNWLAKRRDFQGR